MTKAIDDFTTVFVWEEEQLGIDCVWGNSYFVYSTVLNEHGESEWVEDDVAGGLLGALKLVVEIVEKRKAKKAETK